MRARKNLIFLVLLLLVASGVGYWLRQTSPLHQWEASWQDEQWFKVAQYENWSRTWLIIEKDHYRMLGSGCTGTRTAGKGTITLQGDSLQLHSSGGATLHYRLYKKADLWFVRDDSGEHQQRVFLAPHLRPQRDWLVAGQPLTVHGVGLGMTLTELYKIRPQFRLDKAGYGRCPLSSNRKDEMAVKFDAQEHVCWVRGRSLEQLGRPLLNDRSVLPDVEALLGSHSLNFDNGSAELTLPDLHLTIDIIGWGPEQDTYGVYRVTLSAP